MRKPILLGVLAALMAVSSAGASLISTVTLQQWLKTQMYVFNHEPLDIVGADCVKVDNANSIFSCDLVLRDHYNDPPFDFEIEGVGLRVVDDHPIAVVYCPCR